MTIRRRHVRIASSALTVLVLGLSALPALADHTGVNGWPNGPGDDVRAAPPDDPQFDAAEEGAQDRCMDTSATAPSPGLFGEQYEWFGFASRCAPGAIYREGPRTGQGMIAGASVDRAWQVSTGRPDTVVAVLDTGIDWSNQELDTKVWLNASELPGIPDRNGNGALDILDLCGDRTAQFRCEAADALVPDANPPDPGRGRDTIGNGLLDGEDVLLAFSDGIDDDGNGYVDDIVGWDFFDDDNDPFDASSHASSDTHGTGQAWGVAAETNNGMAGVGSCPQCRLMILRLWDVFLPDTNHYAAATMYAADNGAVATEVAQATLTNPTFAYEATAYAWDHGLLPVVVSSDLNTAHHDYPASDPHVLWINGLVADTEPLNQAPPQTWFRQSNLTQHGAHAHVGVGGDTGSQATAKAAGIVGLLASYARDRGLTLTPNELKQLVTMTAEDVLAGNTLGVGVPDPAQVGWDQHFGYGRVDARAAIDAITAAAIPPEAFLDAPTWFEIVDPDAAVEVRGLARAPRSTGVTWQVQVAAGIEPLDAAFTVVAEGDGPADGVLATIGAGTLRGLFAAGFDFTAPPSDPDAFDVTVRLQVRDADGRLAEDRRMIYARRDPDVIGGWPRQLAAGISASPRLWDLDGDGTLEILLATDDGRLRALEPDGTPLWTFTSDPQPNLVAHASAPGIAALGVPATMLLTPALADLDGDHATDVIVADRAGRVYRLDHAGRRVWTVRVDPALSAPPLRRRNDAVATGMIGAPAIGDLDGDGSLEIVAGALDGHVYAWHADGTTVAGFPVRLGGPAPDPRTSSDAQIVSSPVLVDLDPARPGLEIVAPTNEYLPPTADLFGNLVDTMSTNPAGLPEQVRSLPIQALEQGVAGPDTPVYALAGDGTALAGWPIRLSTAVGNVLPQIAPSVQPAAGDLDGDGTPEVLVSAVTGEVLRVAPDGTIERRYALAQPGPQTDVVDSEYFVPMMEFPAIGDLDGNGSLEALRGGVTLNVVANLLAVGQNVPQSHVFQAWDGATGEFLDAYPRAIADWEVTVGPAVAGVGGGATQALVGNGLYLLDAFGPDGAEPAGWPKFTGGWMISTPAVGDLDGDGTVEVVAGTREGAVHVWATDGAAADADEWWTYGHDERSTHAYGADARPPAAVTDAQVVDGTLTFTAPGDDWRVGRASGYEIRTSHHPIATYADWQRATPLTDVPTPGEPGTVEQVALPRTAGVYVAVVASDEVGNTSPMAWAGAPAPPGRATPTPSSLPDTGSGWPLAGLAVALAALVRRRARRSPA